MHEAQWPDIDPTPLSGRNSLTVARAAPEWAHRQAPRIAPDSRFQLRRICETLDINVNILYGKLGEPSSDVFDRCDRRIAGDCAELPPTICRRQD